MAISGDGIARVEAFLRDGERVVEFRRDHGHRPNLDVREIGVVARQSDGIEEGRPSVGPGRFSQSRWRRIPRSHGDAWVTTDGLGEADLTERRNLELQAAGVMDRQEVREPRRPVSRPSTR